MKQYLMDNISLPVIINLVSVLVMLIMYLYKKTDKHTDKTQAITEKEIDELSKKLHDVSSRVTKMEIKHDYFKETIHEIQISIKEVEKSNNANAQNINETKILIENFKSFITDVIKRSVPK